MAFAHHAKCADRHKVCLGCENAKQLELIDEIERLRSELRRIAEGNLGDADWQADYSKIRAVAIAALKPS